MAQKLLNAAILFKDHVYTERAAMCDLDDVFAADIQYHDIIPLKNAVVR
jgi:hypothetical protein